jgi:hypothetical protein
VGRADGVDAGEDTVLTSGVVAFPSSADGGEDAGGMSELVMFSLAASARGRFVWCADGLSVFLMEPIGCFSGLEVNIRVRFVLHSSGLPSNSTLSIGRKGVDESKRSGT